MPNDPTVTASASAGGNKGFAHRVFSNRLGIGLGFAALGVLLVRPHTLWGPYREWGSLASALLVIGGLALRFWAAGSAGTHTHSDRIQGPRLATTGPYAFVRNPIYLGSMILGLGMIGLIGDGRLLPIYVAAFALLYAILIPAEERFLREKFGADYLAYCACVPRLVPRLRPARVSAAGTFHWQAARGELRIVAVLVGIYAALEIGAWARQGTF
jgi:protein-S-isoprenylcysteine O-methyltransferase Ste14